MFRIEAFVEDKKLAEALRVLAGLVRGQPSVAPVVNAASTKNGVKAETDGSIIMMFERYLRSRPAGTRLEPDQLRKWLTAHGKQPSSMHYLAGLAIKHGLLKRYGKSSKTYYVSTKPPAKKG